MIKPYKSSSPIQPKILTSRPSSSNTNGSHIDNYSINHPISHHLNGHTHIAGQTNKATGQSKQPFIKLTNSSRATGAYSVTREALGVIQSNKTNDENKLMSSGKKRPLETDDLLDLDKSKIRKTLEDMDVNIPIYEDDSEVSEIEQFKDNTIDQLPLDDLDLIRDISDYEFERSMNESLNAKAQPIG